MKTVFVGFPPSEDIAKFWEWFVGNTFSLAEALRSNNVKEISRKIDPQVDRLDKRLGWEIGPGAHQRYSFSFALSGSLENLSVAERIIQAAPLIPGWEFNASLPPKEKWDGRIEFYSSRGHVLALDVSQWRYTLTAFNEREFFDISIMAELPLMDERERQRAAKTALGNIVGEKVMLKRFGRITFMTEILAKDQERSSKFLDLARRLEYLDREKKSLS